MKIFFSPCIYIYHGIVAIFNALISFIKYVFLGIIAFPMMIISLFEKKEKKAVSEVKKTQSAYKKTDILLAEYKKEQSKRIEQEEKRRKKLNEKDEKLSQKRLGDYIADSSLLEKKTDDEKNNASNDKNFSSSSGLKKILNFQIGGKKDKYQNAEELSINFDGPDAEKSSEKQTYEYVIRTPEGKIEKAYFAAFSKVEVHSFLKSQGNIVYSIRTNKWINTMYGSRGGSNDKFKTGDLIFFLAQISTYLKVGIPLSQAVKIMIKQFKNKKYKRILKTLNYDLSTGRSFSEALEKQGNAFPSILINMVKTAEMTGELPETLDDMEEYFSEIEETRKAMITAMMYPTIIFVIAIGVGTFIMLYVVPKFVEIYNSMDNAKIPGITLAVLGLSQFLQKYIVYIAISIVVILILFIYLYKNVKTFKTAIQWLLMHLPVFGDVMIYNEVTTFTKTFASLLSHNVFITDSMEILDKVTNNEIYKSMIYEAINNIAKGRPISEAFKDKWSFPIPAYEMIVTGEKTGQLPEMMQKVSVYYQDLHRNSVTRIKTFVEPTLIILLTVMVGVIVLSIVVPMFSMYGQIQA